MKAPRTTAQVVKSLKADIEEVTGFPPLSVVALEHLEDSWTGRVEVTEFQRVPEAQNLIGIYDVILDVDGNLVSWDRFATRLKGQPFELDGGVE
ncbi:MAG: gas vesicle protein GvpO [Candidatus Nanopelagicales bacterium]